MSSDGTRVTVLGGEDLDRRRLMVPLRYLLAVPHYIWLGVFRFFLLLALPFNWLFTVIQGRQPAIFYELTSGYIRYRSDVLSYVTLLADPYPGFAAVRSYPVETWVPESQPASRISLFFRPLLVLPALLLVVLMEWGLFVSTIAGFVSSLITGRMPVMLQGFGLSALRVIGETSGYAYLIQSSYPVLGADARD